MHYRTFSTWRLIAALVISFYHFLHFHPQGSAGLIAFIERMTPMIDMFFIISGYLIFSAYREKVSTVQDYRAYLARRFARIYPLHVLSMSAFVLVGVAGSFGLVKTGQSALYDFNMILPNLLLVHAWGVTGELSLNYASWCVSAEWLCYLLLPLIVVCHRRWGMPGLALLFVATVIGLEAMTAAGVMPSTWLRADVWGAGRAFADFVVGALIYTQVARQQRGWASQGHAWLALLAALVSMVTAMPAYFAYFLVVASIYLAAMAEQNAPDQSRWQDAFAPVAAVSFGIYMWHPVVELFVCNWGWQRIFEPMGMNFYIFTLIPLVITIGIAWLSNRTIEKWAGRWLNDLLSGKRAARRAGPVAAE